MPIKGGIGKLRHRVELQAEAAAGADDFGAPIEAGWATYAERWAEIVPLSGRELWRAQQSQPDATHQVTLRAAGLEVEPTHRLLFQGRAFHILGPPKDLDERGEVLELTCVERV